MSPVSRASAAALRTVFYGRPHSPVWKHAIFRYLPNRNPSTDQYEISHDWLSRKITRWAENGLNRLAGGGPADRWNITSKTFLTLPYFTILSCVPLQPKRLNRFVRTMAQQTWFAVRKCLLGVASIGNYISGLKSQKKTNIATGMSNLQLNQQTRIT
jgi:hypothetical protein